MTLTIKSLIDKANELIDRGALSPKAVIRVWDDNLLGWREIDIDLENTFRNSLKLKII